jgi:hypothetical protein
MPNAKSTTLSKPWPAFLKEVDTALSRPVSLHCIGGFVLMACYGIPRATGDIDYIGVVPRDAAKEVASVGGPDSALARKYRLFLQGVGVADLPDDYESRLQELDLDLRNLKLWVVDPYDLLLSKLPRNGPKDREDAKFLIQELRLEFATFYSRWQQEMAPWIPNKERHELTVQLWKEYFPK